MSVYTYTKTIAKPLAFEAYLKKNIDWVDAYQGFSQSGEQIYIQSSYALSDDQVAQLDTLVADYVDPPYWLVFDHTVTMPMMSPYTGDPQNTIVNEQDVLQTFIFTNQNTPTLVLDAIKTVVEYNTDNVGNFIDVSNAFVTFNISDCTRMVDIANTVVPLGAINDDWTQQALNGNTNQSIMFKSTMFDGLMNKPPNYDCIWQIRCEPSHSNFFRCRINSLQYLFYQVT